MVKLKVFSNFNKNENRTVVVFCAVVSRNNSKNMSYSSEKTNELSEEAVAPTAEEALDEVKDINIFRSPWKNSDVILVVGNTEFHVHRSVLSMQSPVFERMFNGPFKEASQDKITIEGKGAKDMLEFLIRLYPPNMTETMCIGENLPDYVAILPIADEYQAENVMTECFRKIKVTPENVFNVLPYAEKYNPSVYTACFKVVKETVAFKTLREKVDESGLDGDLATKVLFEKCEFLEFIVSSAQVVTMELFENVMLIYHYKNRCSASSYSCSGLSRGNDASTSEFALPEGCGHTLALKSLHKAKDCEHCSLAYKKCYTDKLGVDYGYKQDMYEQKAVKVKSPIELFELLSVIDDVKNSTCKQTVLATEEALDEDTNLATEEALDEDTNIFHTQWKNSDMILVVGNTDFHLHRYILSMQSPMFERMLNGVSQGKIKIEGKSVKDMSEFLICFYPPNMIKPICDGDGIPHPNYVNILPIADEYQVENVITECFESISITPENVFKVLPYAEKYNPNVHKACLKVLNEKVSFKTLREHFEADDSIVTRKMLLEKGKFLEFVVCSAQVVIMKLFEKAVLVPYQANRSKRGGSALSYSCSGLSRGNDASMSEFALPEGCGHKLALKSLHKAKDCEQCSLAYMKCYTDKLGYDYGYEQDTKELPIELFELLSAIDDIKHSM